MLPTKVHATWGQAIPGIVLEIDSRSYNNIADPQMGKAGSTYARSVQQTHALTRSEMPDAGLVFDTLLRREKVRSP